MTGSFGAYRIKDAGGRLRCCDSCWLIQTLPRPSGQLRSSRNLIEPPCGLYNANRLGREVGARFGGAFGTSDLGERGHHASAKSVRQLFCSAFYVLLHKSYSDRQVRLQLLQSTTSTFTRRLMSSRPWVERRCRKPSRSTWLCSLTPPMLIHSPRRPLTRVSVFCTSMAPGWDWLKRSRLLLMLICTRSPLRLAVT